LYSIRERRLPCCDKAFDQFDDVGPRDLVETPFSPSRQHVQAKVPLS
jgi:hypothetical protein